MHIDSLLPLRLRAVLQFSGEAVHVPAELVERTERTRVQREEEVPDIGPLLVRVDLQPRRGAAEDAAQDVDQEREAVSFVAAEVLAFSAEGEEAAAEALRQSVQDARRIRGASSGFIDRPTVWNRFPRAVIHLDFPARNRGRGHVEDERLLVHRGSRQTDRVRAKDRDPPKRRHDERGCVRHAHADQVVRKPHHRVIARDSVVIRVPHRDDADRGVLRLPDREVHRTRADDLAQALPAIEQRGRFRFFDHPALVRRFHEAFFEAADVAAEARDPMTVDPAQIRDDQDVGRDPRVFRGYAELHQDLLAKVTERFFVDRHRLGHRCVSSDQRNRPARISLRSALPAGLTVPCAAQLGVPWAPVPWRP